MDGEAGPSKATESSKPAELRLPLYHPSLDSQREAPLFADSRLGDLIDDSWTVARLLDAALPSDPGYTPGSRRDIPGLNGELGPFPFHVNQKELKLVREAGTDFIKLLKAHSEESLLEILDEELEHHMTHEHGLIMDQILLGDGIKDIQAASRSFVRDKFSGKESTIRLRERLRERCLAEIADPDSELGRKAHVLVHNLNDFCVDLGARDKAMKSRQELVVPDDREALRKLEAFIEESKEAIAAKAAKDAIEDPEAQQQSKVARTTE